MPGEANVDRRDFLWMMGAASIMPPMVGKAQTPPGATVLYDGRAIVLDRTSPDPAKGDALWIQKSDLPRVNDFELKPQGACRADICIPIPRAMIRGNYFNLSAFAQRVGQRVVADPAERVWSFGEIPVVRGAFLESRMAPDFSVPDRKGPSTALRASRNIRLSQFRGKKVLLVTWASW
jgi:hypothetical protein